MVDTPQKTLHTSPDLGEGAEELQETVLHTLSLQLAGFLNISVFLSQDYYYESKTYKFFTLFLYPV